MSYIQGITSGAAGAAYPKTLTLPGPVTVGNTVLVLLFHSYGGTPVSCSDSLGNGPGAAYAHDVVSQFFVPHFFHVFRAPVTTGGACTITLTSAGGVVVSAFAIEVSGFLASPFDGYAGNSNGAPGACNAGTITTTTDGDYVLALFASEDSGNQSYTPTGGATLLLTQPSGSILQAQTQSVAGNITPSATGAGDIGGPTAPAGSVAYKVAAAPASSPAYYQYFYGLN